MANMAKIENCTHPASKAKIDAIRAFLHQETKENGSEPDATGSNLTEQEPQTDMNFSRPIDSRPWDRKEYLKRLHSYTLLGWFAKPPWLSPLHCARYGWKNTEPDLLQCVSCKAYVSGHLSSTYDPQVYNEYCAKLRDSLQSAHHPCCPWISNPSPESFMNIPVDCESEAGKEYKARLEQLLTLGRSLPHIISEKVNHIKDNGGAGFNRIMEICRDDRERDEETTLSAVTLAVCGWTCSSSKRGLIHCEFCKRTAGIWQHKSLDYQSPQHSDVEDNADLIQPHDIVTHITTNGHSHFGTKISDNSSSESASTEPLLKNAAGSSDKIVPIEGKDGSANLVQLDQSLVLSEDRPQEISNERPTDIEIKSESSLNDLHPLPDSDMSEDEPAANMNSQKLIPKIICSEDLPPLLEAGDVDEAGRATMLLLAGDDMMRGMVKQPAWDTASMEVHMSDRGSVCLTEADDLSVTDTASVQFTDLDNTSTTEANSFCMADDDVTSVSGTPAISVSNDEAPIFEDIKDVQITRNESLKLTDLNELSIADDTASMDVQVSETGSVRISDVVSVSDCRDTVSSGDESEVVIDVVEIDESSEFTGVLPDSSLIDPGNIAAVFPNVSHGDISGIPAVDAAGQSMSDAASVEVQVWETESVRLADVDDISVCEDMSMPLNDSYDRDQEDVLTISTAESEVDTTIDETDENTSIEGLKPTRHEIIASEQHNICESSSIVKSATDVKSVHIISDEDMQADADDVILPDSHSHTLKSVNDKENEGDGKNDEKQKDLPDETALVVIENEETFSETPSSEVKVIVTMEDDDSVISEQSDKEHVSICEDNSMVNNGSDRDVCDVPLDALVSVSHSDTSSSDNDNEESSCKDDDKRSDGDQITLSTCDTHSDKDGRTGPVCEIDEQTPEDDMANYKTQQAKCETDEQNNLVADTNANDSDIKGSVCLTETNEVSNVLEPSLSVTAITDNSNSSTIMSTQLATGATSGEKRSILMPAEGQRPTKKRKNVERLPFDPISEHRAWCPWASEQQLIRMGKSQEETVAKRPGWQQLLEALVQEVSPEKSSISRIVKTTPPREALRSIRRLFDDWTSSISAPVHSSPV